MEQDTAVCLCWEAGDAQTHVVSRGWRVMRKKKTILPKGIYNPEGRKSLDIRKQPMETTQHFKPFESNLH
jgi:hypothetical protein